ncbi:coenzyme F420-0:L-glutamate ligase [Nonomuraea sp. NPDC050328]|uniref:coenzyme F420-0:L-glutamate ligase n=1 Tax=Nonomuraea sp. NPDC050328 TaxID=3364361 RepID=UPI00378B860B
MITIVPVTGLGEVRPGDDLAALLAGADVRDGDIVVITSKIVSKAEGRIRHAPDRAAAIAEETERVVARRGDTVIAQTRHGFVMAAAGVDASNTEPGTVLLLPEDADESARRIRKSLGKAAGVVITDTFGRPWRHGLTDVAIGAAGVQVLEDFRGGVDTHGNPLVATVTALADEIAAAAELVKGKLTGVPVALVRGLAHLVTAEDGPGVRPLVRPADEDLFRYGSRDVVHARRTATAFADRPVSPGIVRQAVSAALTAPAVKAGNEGTTAETAGNPGNGVPWRFVLVESAEAGERLRAAAPEVPASAPGLLVPCLAGAEPDRPNLLALGASVENLLVQLAVEGVAAAWVFPEEVALDLPRGWTPAGVVAYGYPATPQPERLPPDPAGFIEVR